VRFRGSGLEDLIAEGNLGLLRAVECFDPSFNTRFSTYASYWIKQSIRRYLIGTAKTVRLPFYMVDLIAKWRGWCWVTGRKGHRERWSRGWTFVENGRELGIGPVA
jgi:RNA polymerase sigma factor (sigma-70 family)